MEKSSENWIWFVAIFVLCVGLILATTSAFGAMFPEIVINKFWLWGYLAIILSATFHYRQDSARLKITVLFVILPVGLMFLLTWIFKDFSGPYGYILKTNLPRSILTAGVICFFYYTLYINRSDTLKEAQRKKDWEDRQAQRKKDWENKIEKKE